MKIVSHHTKYIHTFDNLSSLYFQHRTIQFSNNYIHPYKYIKENPMFYVKEPKTQENKKSKEDLKVLSLDNFNKIIKRFPQGTSFYVPLQTAFHTGLLLYNGII